MQVGNQGELDNSITGETPSKYSRWTKFHEFLSKVSRDKLHEIISKWAIPLTVFLLLSCLPL